MKNRQRAVKNAALALLFIYLIIMLTFIFKVEKNHNFQLENIRTKPNIFKFRNQLLFKYSRGIYK